MDFIKSKTCVLWKTPTEENTYEVYIGEKKNLYAEYVKNSQNVIIKQTTHLKNGQKLWAGTSPKRYTDGIWAQVRCSVSSVIGKCKFTW